MSRHQQNSAHSQDFKFKGADEAPEDDLEYKGVYFNPLDTKKPTAPIGMKKKASSSHGYRNKFDQFEKQSRSEVNAKATAPSSDISQAPANIQPRVPSKNIPIPPTNDKQKQNASVQQGIQSSASSDDNHQYAKQEEDSQGVQQQNNYNQKQVDNSKNAGMSQQMKFQRSSQFKVGGQCTVAKANKRRRVPGKLANVSPIPVQQRGISNSTKYPQKKLKPQYENPQDSSQDELDDDLEDDDVAFTQKFPNQQSSGFGMPQTNVNRSYDSSSEQSGGFNQQLAGASTVVRNRNSTSQSNDSEIEESVPRFQTSARGQTGFGQTNSHINEKTKPDQGSRAEQGFQQNGQYPSKQMKDITYVKQKVVSNLDVEESVVIVKIEKVNFKPFQTVIAEILHVQKVNKEIVDVELKKKQIVQAILKQSHMLQTQLLVGQTYLFRFKSAFKHDNTPVLNVEDYQQIDIPAQNTAQI